jgi:sugar lactone lactonase YvrE
VSESIVPQGSQSSFSPNYIAVGGDGTIYVTEWSFSSTDTLAGLYIYPVSGPERYYSAGAEAPNGIDLDASGNIYVVNNNTAYDSGNPSADTA